MENALAESGTEEEGWAMTERLKAQPDLTAALKQALTDHLLETLEDAREWAREGFHRLMNGRCYKERDREESFRQQMAAMRHAVMKQIAPTLADHDRAHAEAIHGLTEERDAAKDSADAAIANLQHSTRMRAQAEAERDALAEQVRQWQSLVIEPRGADAIRAEAEAKGRSDVLAMVRKLRPWQGVTSGANPLPEGGMSSPVWHMHCRWCDARASVTQWKHPIAEGHPANGCLWALAQADAPAKEMP